MESLQELLAEDKELSKIDSNIKGAIAETIAEEMFRAMGFEVRKYGQEFAVPGFGSREVPQNGEAADVIRLMPDLVVTKDRQTFLLEVKYRANGKFNLNEFVKSKKIDAYPYLYAYVVLFSPDHIKIQKAEDLIKGADFVYLDMHTDFKDFVDANIIKVYLRSCWKYFDTE
ncbi:hypothetical protein COB64_04260 [Candidatus Wolfebacteria bacterium]|nr:MAG: hypothetical protein COB64_04260 [Candidatus Wolfebacteria bacterium]